MNIVFSDKNESTFILMNKESRVKLLPKRSKILKLLINEFI